MHTGVGDATDSPPLVLLFGGSFDPPTRAHVELPRVAMDRIGADAVWYLPAALSPFKADRPPAPAKDRLAMLRLALREAPWARIRSDELERAERNEPSYTIDTLRGLPRDRRYRLLIGADQAEAFDRWKEAPEIEALAEPVVLPRPPQERDQLVARLPERWRSRVLDLAAMDLSSTAVRERLKRGEPIERLVPAEVASYIRRNNLYISY